MSELAITVVENNDPVLTFTLYTDDAQTTTADLTNAVVEMYIKSSVKDLDADALAKYSTATGEITVVGPATDGKVQVAVNGDHFGSKNKVYHLDVVVNDKRLTYAYGTLEVVNI